MRAITLSLKHMLHLVLKIQVLLRKTYARRIFNDFTRAKKWKRISQYEYLFIDNP